MDHSYIQHSLVNEYTELYKNKKENYERLTIISIHLLYFRLYDYKKLKHDFLLTYELKDEILKTLQDIEKISVEKEYVDEFLLLHKKFKELL